jgi:hypothetical protein
MVIKSRNAQPLRSTYLEEKEDQLIIHYTSEQRKGRPAIESVVNGLVYSCVGIIFLGMLAWCVFYIVATIINGDDWFSISFLAAVFFALLPFVFVFGWIQQAKRKYHAQLIFDRKKEQLKYLDALTGRYYGIGYAHIDHYLIKVRRDLRPGSGQSNTSRKGYIISFYLVLKNNTRIWIRNTRHPNEFYQNSTTPKKFMDTCRSYLQLPVQDSSKLELSTEGKEVYTNIDKPTQAAPSNYLIEKKMGENRVFRLLRPKTAYDGLVQFFLTFFVLLFVAMVASIGFEPGSNPLVKIYSMIFISVLLFVIYVIRFIIIRDYEIATTASGLLIKLRNGPLGLPFSRVEPIYIPFASIQSVELDRAENDVHHLEIHLNQPLELEAINKFWYNIGLLEGAKEKVSLWSVYLAMGTKGPQMGDLLYVKKEIETHLIASAP